MFSQGVGRGIDVAEMMTTWTNQMGFPVITVERDRNNPSRVYAMQQRFLIHPETKRPSDAA